MTPILGITASQITGHLWAPSNSYDSIATTTVGAGGASTITFSSIPSTYRHLQIRVNARSTYAGTGDGYLLKFNGVGGTSYAYHLLIGNGSTASAGSNTSVGYIVSGDLPAATETANIFGSLVVDVLDYANTNKYKTTRSLSGDDRNGSGSVRFISGLFMDTTAISSATLTLLNGGNFAQYTSAALYGIR
jgi:hypothetical protein